MFNTIVGNPPYFKLKENPNTKSILKTTNVYVAFIEKAYNLLSDTGELIFIIPSDFFKLTSASKLKDEMLKNGSFTHIFHPHKENLFQKATQDVIVFRYQKGLHQNTVIYNDVHKGLILSQGNVYFREKNDTEGNEVRVDELFTVKVGMVSGAEKIFENIELGNIQILTSSGTKQQILVDVLPDENDKVFAYLAQHKECLINRKIKKFSDSNWFQWGCLRNKKFMEEHKGDACIYAMVLTRKKDVFRLGKVGYYDGSLLCMHPKQSINTEQLESLVQYLNTEKHLQHFLYSGRYKVGQKTLADSYIPNSLFGL
jgi:adenine-specific DNA-methyltransferase